MKAGAAEAAWADLSALCALGGRFAGSDSEARAVDFLAARLRDVAGVDPVPHAVRYAGWRRGEAVLETEGGERLPCVSLVRSPPTPAGGLVAEVLDLGRGTEADFERAAAALPGRIALVRHEYMFSSVTVHRRRKYGWAMAHGAAGFLIASHLPGELPVTGSTGAAPGEGIPAAGISSETAALVAGRRVRLHLETEEQAASAQNLVVDLPGRGAQTVVLSAHLDGHHLAESAMDNATGVAAVLAVARALAPRVAGFERGLRIALFNVEEWALTGSREYVAGLDAASRDAIALVLNLDSVAGSPRLTALVSGFPAIGPFLAPVAAAAGMRVGVHLPPMANSDHHNFAVEGIPALRLVAGFDEPASALRYVLTPGDRLDRVQPAELDAAVRLVTALAEAACTAPAPGLRDGWQGP